MSSKADDLIRRAERGGRVALVRLALGDGVKKPLPGEEFAERVNAAGRAFGYDLGYDKSKLSRVEGGGAANFTAEEAVAIASLDPEERGVEWLVSGNPKRRRERRVG